MSIFTQKSIVKSIWSSSQARFFRLWYIMEMMWEILSAVACIILLGTGFIGCFLPVLPGIPLAWAGIFIYALGTGFENISVLTVVILLLVTAAVMAIGYFAPMLGAKKYKASRAGIVGAFLGLIVGLIFFNILGIIIGPFLGALVGELIANRAPGDAFESAFGTLLGYLAGTLLQAVVILIMAGIFIVSLF